MRYDAYDARAVERILEGRFKPRSLAEQMADTTRAHIRAAMRAHPVMQRPLIGYAAQRAGDGSRLPLSTPRDDHEEDPKPCSVEGEPQQPL